MVTFQVPPTGIQFHFFHQRVVCVTVAAGLVNFFGMQVHGGGQIPRQSVGSILAAAVCRLASAAFSARTRASPLKKPYFSPE